MKHYTLVLLSILVSIGAWAQTGHVMQGAGAVNMSMGGAATGQPTDISGALLWNPAAISAFDNTTISINAGAFFSSPEVSSSLPANMAWDGAPPISGTTQDDRGTSVMPALSVVWGKKESKHRFGASAIGVSGFGVTFPEEENNPMSDSFDPTQNSNVLLYPQAAGGFGHLESDYMLLQVSFTYSLKINENFSIGIQPQFNYSGLELIPNPLANPSMDKGYPVSDKASAIGYGGQVGLFYDTKTGFKFGAAYKTPQYFDEFEFSNKYLDGSEAPGNSFRMDYPGILSVGTGYSMEKFDVALDVRRIFYSNTEGFEKQGWNQFGSVTGFGWNDITVASFGFQYKGFEKWPLRLGYTYSGNPIEEELAFFSTPATAVIKHAFQIGLGLKLSDNMTLNGVYHYGTSSGDTKGNLLNPMMVNSSNPYGAIPGTSVSYSMTTSMVMFGLNYTFLK